MTVLDDKEAYGIVRFAGITEFDKGNWVGIELDEPWGKNTGTVRDVTYFECIHGHGMHGVFVRPHKIVPTSVDDNTTNSGMDDLNKSPPIPNPERFRKKRAQMRVQALDCCPEKELEDDEQDGVEAQAPGQGSAPSPATPFLYNVMPTLQRPPKGPLEGQPSTANNRSPATAVEERDTDKVHDFPHTTHGSEACDRRVQSAQHILSFEEEREQYRMRSSIKIDNTITALEVALSLKDACRTLDALGTQVSGLACRLDEGMEKTKRIHDEKSVQIDKALIDYVSQINQLRQGVAEYGSRTTAIEGRLNDIDLRRIKSSEQNSFPDEKLARIDEALLDNASQMELMRKCLEECVPKVMAMETQLEESERGGKVQDGRRMDSQVDDIEHTTHLPAEPEHAKPPLEDKIAQLVSQLDQMCSRLDEYETHSAEMLEAYGSRFSTLCSHVAENEHSNSTFEERICKLSKNLEDINGRFVDMHMQGAEQDETNKAFEVRLNQLNSQMVDASKGLEEHGRRLFKMSMRIDDEEKSINTIDRKVAQLDKSWRDDAPNRHRAHTCLEGHEAFLAEVSMRIANQEEANKVVEERIALLDTTMRDAPPISPQSVQGLDERDMSFADISSHTSVEEQMNKSLEDRLSQLDQLDEAVHENTDQINQANKCLAEHERRFIDLASRVLAIECHQPSRSEYLADVREHVRQMPSSSAGKVRPMSPERTPSSKLLEDQFAQFVESFKHSANRIAAIEACLRMPSAVENESCLEPEMSDACGKLAPNPKDPQEFQPVKSALPMCPRRTYGEAFEEAGGNMELEANRERSQRALRQVRNMELEQEIVGLFRGSLTRQSCLLVRQPFTVDCDSLYRMANVALVSFNLTIEQLAARTGGRALLCARLKSKKRARMKANNLFKDEEGLGVAWHRLTDLVRATIEYPDVAGMYQGFESIVQSFGPHVRAISDRYMQPMEGGYRDITVMVEHEDHVCELQLNTAAMLEAGADYKHRSDDMKRELEPAVVDGELERVGATMEWCAELLGRGPVLAGIATELVHTAAMHGHADIVHCLWNCHADVNAADKHGNTPLHLAADCGHETAVWALVGCCHAQVQATNHDGETPLDLAYMRLRRKPDSENAARTVAVLASTEGLARFRQARCHVDSLFSTKLFNAPHLVSLARDGCVMKLHVELEHFADPNSTDADGRSALSVAAEAGNLQAVESLLSYGASTKALNSRGLTALEVAWRGGHTDVASILLDVDAAPTIAGLAGQELSALRQVVPLLELGSPQMRQEATAALIQWARAGVEARVAIAQAGVIPALIHLWEQSDPEAEKALRSLFVDEGDERGALLAALPRPCLQALRVPRSLAPWAHGTPSVQELATARLQGLGSDAASTCTDEDETRSISSTCSAFAAVKSDGSVETWGCDECGGDSKVVANHLVANVRHVFSTHRAFAAVKCDGSLVTWGDAEYGGDSADVCQLLSTGVKDVYSTHFAFAAVKTDGSVVTWGNAELGGDSTDVKDMLASNVRNVCSTWRAFAALKGDGSVVTWGRADAGGDSKAVQKHLASDVKCVYSTKWSFAAVKNIGSVVTWGAEGHGGDSKQVQDQLASGVEFICSTDGAFAAMKKDGSVATWGFSEYGGDCSDVSEFLASNVRNIHSSRRAFAAVVSDGSVVTWGFADHGGDSTYVQEQLTTGVKHIYANDRAFAALKSDGSVVTWGDSSAGGDCADVQKHLTSNVKEICCTSGAMAALRYDGVIVTWGNQFAGGDSTHVQAELSGNVERVFANDGAFAAVKVDGSIITWGVKESGGRNCSMPCPKARPSHYPKYMKDSMPMNQSRALNAERATLCRKFRPLKLISQRMR